MGFSVQLSCSILRHKGDLACSLDARKILPAMVACHGRACLLPDVHQTHGLQVHEQEVIFTRECQGKGHHYGPHLQHTTEEGGACGEHIQGEVHELPYIHGVLQYVQSIIELEYPFKGDWTVIKPPDWVALPDRPSRTFLFSLAPARQCDCLYLLEEGLTS